MGDGDSPQRHEDQYRANPSGTHGAGAWLAYPRPCLRCGLVWCGLRLICEVLSTERRASTARLPAIDIGLGARFSYTLRCELQFFLAGFVFYAQQDLTNAKKSCQIRVSPSANFWPVVKAGLPGFDSNAKFAEGTHLKYNKAERRFPLGFVVAHTD